VRTGPRIEQGHDAQCADRQRVRYFVAVKQPHLRQGWIQNLQLFTTRSQPSPTPLAVHRWERILAMKRRAT